MFIWIRLFEDKALDNLEMLDILTRLPERTLEEPLILDKILWPGRLDLIFQEMSFKKSHLQNQKNIRQHLEKDGLNTHGILTAHDKSFLLDFNRIFYF